MKDPKIPESAAAHAAEDDELRVGPVRVGVADGRVRLSRRRRRAEAGRNLPLKLVCVGSHLKRVQVVQVSRNRKNKT